MAIIGSNIIYFDTRHIFLEKQNKEALCMPIKWILPFLNIWTSLYWKGFAQEDLELESKCLPLQFVDDYVAIIREEKLSYLQLKVFGRPFYLFFCSLTIFLSNISPTCFLCGMHETKKDILMSFKPK